MEANRPRRAECSPSSGSQPATDPRILFHGPLSLAQTYVFETPKLTAWVREPCEADTACRLCCSSMTSTIAIGGRDWTEATREQVICHVRVRPRVTAYTFSALSASITVGTPS